MPIKGKKRHPLTKKTTEHLRKVFTAKIIISCIMIFLLVVIAIFLCFHPPMKPVSTISDLHNFRMGEGLANNTEIKQSFVASDDAESLGIYFNNYDVFLESGYLDIKVNQDSLEIFHQSINVDQLQNGQFFYIGCALTAGNTYEIDIAIHSLEKIDRIAFMVTDTADEGSLIINGTRQDSNLVLSYAHHTPDYFAVWYCIFGIILIVVYIVLFVNREAYEK